MNRLILNFFSKIEPKLAQILEKSCDFAWNWADWYMNGSLFLENLEFVWVYYQILRQYIPTKNQTWVPPRQDTLTESVYIMGTNRAHPYFWNTTVQPTNKLMYWFCDVFELRKSGKKVCEKIVRFFTILTAKIKAEIFELPF